MRSANSWLMPFTRNILDRGVRDPLQSTELFHQLLAPFGAKPGYALQHRGVTHTCAPLAVAGDGKSVRFVADLLYQVQGR